MGATGMFNFGNHRLPRKGTLDQRNLIIVWSKADAGVIERIYCHLDGLDLSSGCRPFFWLLFHCLLTFVDTEKERQITLYSALLSNYCLCLPEQGNLAKLRYVLCLTGFLTERR
jgi:hypothetical protein